MYETQLQVATYFRTTYSMIKFRRSDISDALLAIHQKEQWDSVALF